MYMCMAIQPVLYYYPGCIGHSVRHIFQMQTQYMFEHDCSLNINMHLVIHPALYCFSVSIKEQLSAHILNADTQYVIALRESME